EDGSFSFTGAPDGAYSFDYTLYLDGVDSGSTTVTLTVGSGVITHATTGALVNGGATINGNALHTVPGAGVYPPQAQVLSGVVYGPTGAEFTGTMSILLDLNTGRLVKIIGQKVALLL
nr:hypothetical protein [bacterium]